MLPASTERIFVKERTALWRQGFVFLFGFCIQFNMLVGGGGAGAASTGGYGYRVVDILCVVAIGILGIEALTPRRFFPLAIFSIIVGVIAGLRLLDPALSDDPRTRILELQYVAYCFAGLYLAKELEDQAGRETFCWGLIMGLIATVPIFMVEGAGYTSTLVDLGLVPGWFQVYYLDVGETLRYAGLWGHPNEAAHVAALAAPAAAYLALVRRRVLPTALVAGGLLAIFYYTTSRGGLMVGAAVLAIPLLFGRDRRIDLLRLVLAGAAIGICFVVLSQLDFISSRFEDPNTQGNFSIRLDSILVGLEVAFTHPFGLSLEGYHSLIAAGTGGLPTPHNGFIFYAAFFGWVPFAIVIYSIATSFFIRSDADVLFALISTGLTMTFMFEAYPFALVVCMIVGHAYVRTKIGSDLTTKVAFKNGLAFRLPAREIPRR